VNDPGFKVPLDDPGKKSLKKSFENLAGPASHSSPVEHSELDISSGGADSEGYVGDFTVDESQLAGDARVKHPGKSERPIYGKDDVTSGKMEAHKPKKRKKVVKSSEIVESDEESERPGFTPLLAERLRSRTEVQAEILHQSKALKSVVSKTMSTPGETIPGKATPGKATPEKTLPGSKASTPLSTPGKPIPGSTPGNRSPDPVPDSTPVTVQAEVHASHSKSKVNKTRLEQVKHCFSTKKSGDNPAVSHAELELHAPEGYFDEDESDSTSQKKSDHLFSREQMQFLGTYLKDMLLSVMKPASAQEKINTTLSHISMAKTQKSDKETSSKSMSPPAKKRKVETTTHYQRQDESEDDELECEFDEPEDIQDGYEDEGNEEEYDDDDKEDEDDEEEYIQKGTRKTRRLRQESDLKEEEKQEESMNLSLAEQLARIQSYFPDKVLSSDPPKLKIERPQEQIRKSVITGLPLHQMIQDNLQQLREEVLQGNTKASTDKENAGYDTGKFPK